MDLKKAWIFVDGERVTEEPWKNLPDKVYLLGGLSGGGD